MSAEGWAAIPNWMVRDPDVKPNMLAVYAVIQSHAGASGTTALRHRTIATEAGVSVDTVKRAVKALNELGVLWWEGTTNGEGFGANIYHPLQERHVDLVDSSHSPHPPRSTEPDSAPTPVQISQKSAPTPPAKTAESSGSPRRNVRSSAPTPVQDAAPTPVQNGGVGAVSTQVGAHSTTKEEESFLEEPPLPPQARRAVSSDKGFSEFWGSYPPTEWKQKTSKTNLRGFWFSLDDEQRRLALQALKAYAASEQWIDRPESIPGPKMWLENEPWLEVQAGNLPKAKPPPRKWLSPEDVRLPD